jgi:hypothetical protein
MDSGAWAMALFPRLQLNLNIIFCNDFILQVTDIPSKYISFDTHMCGLACVDGMWKHMKYGSIHPNSNPNLNRLVDPLTLFMR